MMNRRLRQLVIGIITAIIMVIAIYALIWIKV